MKKELEEIGFEDVEFISHPKENVWYIGYKVKVKRGIRGKAKGFVNEVLIVGMNDEHFVKWCMRHKIFIKEGDRKDLEWVYDCFGSIYPNTDPDKPV